MSKNALNDVRTLLEGESRPLSLEEVVERLGGQHGAVAVENLLEHFRLEGKAAMTSDGGWGWRHP